MKMETEALYRQRRQRLDRALHLEKPGDRMPVLLPGPIPCAKYADPAVICADATRRPEAFIELAFEGVDRLADADALNNFMGGYGRGMSYVFMCPVKLPGVDIGEDDNLQVCEEPHLAYEDYARIVDGGWAAFAEAYAQKYFPCTPEELAYEERFGACVKQKFDDTGYVRWGGAVSPSPWDILSSMRGMTRFFRDLRKDPQLIHEVIDAIDAVCFADFTASLPTAGGYSAMVQPGVRSNCDFVSREIYEEFTWPLTLKYANAVIEAGLPVHFHYDSNWDSFLDFFTCFPKGTCIFDSDGATDILKVKRTLGDRMAITGNTPSALLVLGTPDDVYGFVKDQIRQVGEEGYIVSSSCTIPSNAKPENVRAMVAASRA